MSSPFHANRLGLLIAPRDLLPGAPDSRVLTWLATRHALPHVHTIRLGDDLIVLFSDDDRTPDARITSILEGRWPQPLGYRVSLRHDGDPRWQVQHDHAGIRPLFYGRDDTHRMIVSTFPEAVACLVDGGMSLQTLAQQLLVGFPLGRHTVFDGVNRLQCGESVNGQDVGAPRTAHAGAPDDERRTVDWISPTRQRVAEAFAHGAALELSGGIDSRLVLAMGMSLGQKPKLAFTLGDSNDADVRIARRICDRYGIPHRVHAPEGDPERCLDDAHQFCMDSGYVVNTFAYAWLPHVFRLLGPDRTAQIGGGGGECATGFYHSPFDALCRSPFMQRQWILRRLILPGIALESIFTDEAASHYTQHVLDALDAIMQTYEGEWWRRSDQFYRLQRCVNAGGPVLAASARWYQPIQPLLDVEHLRWSATLSRAQRAFRTTQMKQVHTLNQWLGRLPYAGGTQYGWTALTRLRSIQHRGLSLGKKIMTRINQSRSTADLGATGLAATLQRDSQIRTLQHAYVAGASDSLDFERLETLGTIASETWHELGMLTSHALAHRDLTTLRECLQHDQRAFFADHPAEQCVA
jgi:hypothetical protein